MENETEANTYFIFVIWKSKKREERRRMRGEEEMRRRRRGATPCRTHIDCEGGGGLSTSEARHAANQEK